MTTKTKTAPAVKPNTTATPAPVVAEAPKEVAVKNEPIVKVAAAKGRPMLSWVGKRPLGLITAFPAQPVERVDPQHVLGPEASDAYAHGGLLFHGDNKEVLAHLLASGFRGKVKVIYIDPPFDSGADYVRKVSLRGGAGGAKLEGETYTLGEQKQYTDIWANDNYLQFMFERLLLLKELLAEDGSLYLHCDQHQQHRLRMLMDEVFGEENFKNVISRIKCNPKNMERKAFGNIHDYILSYSKTQQAIWNKNLLDINNEEVIRLFPKLTQDARRYTTTPLHAPGTRTGVTGKHWKGIPPPAGRHWRMIPTELDKLEDADLIEWSSNQVPRRIVYADDVEGKLIQDVWYLKDPMYSTYPTEKNEEMVSRLIAASSNAGDIVLDSFIGSGTTVAVAQKLGRRWIGCDINKGAIQTTSKRLQAILAEQIAAKGKPVAKNGKMKAVQPKLDVDDMGEAEGTAIEVPATAQPAQLAFSLWRVNDYDLQIQHNEAVELACQHLGVTRTKGDSFFEGTRGQSLVKIVPFNHPLSPLDLEEVKTALSSRPDETRAVLMVCLGVELAAQGWLEEYNRLRKVSDPNRIDYIELRTDPKYGKFFAHQPAVAQVTVTRHGETGRVKLHDFASPTILERLAQTAGVLSPKIDDWRAMVDCVLIDTAYDGQVFNVAFSDVPEKKTDLISGEYDLPLPQTPTTVGVKIIDMLGEEVLETMKV